MTLTSRSPFGRSNRSAARRPIRKAALAAAFLASAFGALPAWAESLVLSNFTLIDGRGGPAVPGSSMVVTDGRIIWVGPSSQAKAPAGAQTVDLTGKFVTPGLIDTHIHLGNVEDLTQDQKFYTRANVEKDLKTYASYGYTAVAIMGTDKDVIFDIRKEQRSGRPTEARIFTSGQGIVFNGGYGGVPGINRVVSTPEQAAAEVDNQAHKGVDYIKFWLDDELKTMPKMPVEIRKAVIDAAHRNGLRVFAHIFYLEDAKNLTDLGVDGFVHSVRDQPIDDALIASMKAHDTVQVAGTLSREAAMFAYGADSPRLHDHFFEQSLSPAALAQLSSPERQKTVSSAPVFKKLPGFYEQAKSNLKKLADNGIAFGAGTDSGPPGRVPGYSGHWELQAMIEAGLTPAQALYSATGGAAKVLGAKDIGTLEGAKWADFVVLDANPLQDINNTRKINAVYIAGQKVPTVKP